MKLNISNPTNGTQKVIECDDERKLRAFYDKRISQEVEGSVLGEEFKGYIFRISGGNDKQGFPMMQGVLVNNRVRLLLDANSKCFRPRRHGQRRRKSVRGCIVGPDLSVLNLVVVKKGDEEIPGLTDESKPRRLGPKRASNIRKLFNLSKEDDVRKYVIRHSKTRKNGSVRMVAPKIQRLVTPRVLMHKRRLKQEKFQRNEKSKAEAQVYQKLLQQRLQEAKKKRASEIARRRSSRRASKEEK